MKKLITILVVMIILVGAVFAAENVTNTLTINAKVARKLPAYAMTGTLHGGSATATVNKTTTTGTIETNVDISENPVTIDVAIVQNQASQYKGTINLSVAATAMTDGTITSSKTPTASETITAGGTTGKLTVTPSGASSATVGLELVYSGKKVTADTSVASFSFTWAADDTLPPAENGDQVYHSTIVLTYTLP